MAEIIDSHQHLWKYTSEEYGWITSEMEVLQRDFLPEDLHVELTAAGVDGCIAVQARQTLEETRWLLELSAEDPKVRGVVGWVPLCDPTLPKLLGRLAANGKLKGVRHVLQDEIDEEFMLRADFNRGISRLTEAGLAYDVLIHERHLPVAFQFVKQHPDQRFVLDHLAKPQVRHGPFGPWKDGLAKLASCRNVFCKLSGLITEANWATWTIDDLRPYLDAALREFGAERLMAGSDWPVCLLAGTYQAWWSALQEWSAPLPPEKRAQIFGGTATQVYGL